MGKTKDSRKKGSQVEEDSRARKRSNRGRIVGEEGSSQPQQQFSYSERFCANNPRDTTWSDLFYREDRRERYNQIKSFKFTQEKGFSDDLAAIPDFSIELEGRRWVKFNNLMNKDKFVGNEQLVREFFANAWREPYHVHTDKAYVRGVMVDFSALALNEFLETYIPDRCAVEEALIDFARWPEVRRSEIKDFVGRPGTQWLKYSGGEFPTKIRLGDFKPVARAWAEFVLHNVSPVSNSSEYQVENALVVKMIMERQVVNLGQLLCKSIRKIANNGQPTFSLGHCNLITALCRFNDVPEINEDIPFKPIRAMTLKYFEGYENGPVVAQERGARARANVRAGAVRGELQEEEDEEVQQFDRYERGEHPNQQHPHQMPHQLYTEDDISALMTQLAIARACNVPHTYYGDQSAIYQEARAREANFRPPPLYPQYSTLARLQAQQNIENAHIAARHLDEQERWQQEYDACQNSQMFPEGGLNLRDRQDGSGPSYQP